MCGITALAAGSIGLQALGSVQQAQQANETAKYNAAVSRQNATLADNQADDAISRGADEANRYRQQTRQLQGQQRTAIAASGIDPTQGSAVEVLTDTTMNRALDESRIRANAAREAYGYRTQGQSYRAQARRQKYESKQQAAGSILGGLTNIASTGARTGMIGGG